MLHGQFLRKTDEEAGKEGWLWLRSTGIKENGIVDDGSAGVSNTYQCY